MPPAMAAKGVSALQATATEALWAAVSLGLERADGGAPFVVVFDAVSELTVGVEVTRLVVSDVGGLKVGELVGREA